MAMELPHLSLLLSLLLFLLFLLLPLPLLNFASAQEGDTQALLEWKKGIAQDPSGLLLGWGAVAATGAADPCSWRGVSCSPVDRRVVKLQLPGGRLSGRLCGDCLASLEFLQFLDLSGNTLAGGLSSLAVSFSSAHPCRLQSLNLSRSGLVGEIPPDLLASCGHIRELDLSVNSLRGEIPSAFFLNSGLRLLNLSHNQLVGELPSDNGSYSYASSSLNLLDLSSNNISGPIPASLVCFSSIVTLRLSSNSFSGPLPAIFGNNCSPVLIKTLDLSSNRLAGALPQSLCRTLGSTLEELRLKNNRISGGIPPASLSNCTRLKILDLSFNRLEGKIPPDLALLSGLEILSMWYNNLSGSIPPEIGTMQKLRTIVLNNNMLSGRIPPELANCSSLEWLSLSGNRLTGAIPAQFGRLEKLTLLELAENSLTGELPRELGNCSYLLWLDVHANRLSGPIHPRLGRYATGPPAISLLSGDNVAFIRHLGVECAGLGMLVEFGGMTEEALNTTPLVQSCAWVRLYDGPTLNDNPDYSTIQYVDLSRNWFSGRIPAELGHMRALQMLDLSRNDLVGPIPGTFAGLTHLGVLDLSHNRLEGNLWPLTNCSFLVQVDVSFNNFSGTIPSVGQIGTAPESSFASNPLLCGPPLPACGLLPWLSATGGGKPTSSSTISWQNNVILGVMIAAAFAGLLIAWAILAAKSRKAATGCEANNNTIMLGAVSGKSKSSCLQDGWNFSGGGEKEPLSINVATFERPLRKLTFPQLIEATNGFSPESLIGTGGFGEVYKATLREGAVVAVKKLVQCSYQGDREFIAEMETLGKIKHRNLVPLLGYCKVGEERLLVYEYMHGGSLEDLLHSEAGGAEREAGTGITRPPEWEVRKQIAKGAARGLAFLHHNCIPHIIHRDMKSSNVLLDDNLEARVSDFGMARLISALDTHLSVSTLAGTPGYVPPEYYQSFRCTAKGDVYSFGVVLLELLTGKRPTDKEEFGDTNLVGWVKLHLAQKKGPSVLDPYLTGEVNPHRTREVTTSNPTTPTTTTRDPLALLEPHHTTEVTIANPTACTVTTRDQDDGAQGSHVYEMMQYLYLACDCLQDVASRRPTMLQVVARLKEISTEC